MSVATRRPLTFQRLESRLALSVTALGDELLVNDHVLRYQSIGQSTSAIVSSTLNSAIVYEGRGPGDGDGVFAKIFDSTGATIAPSFRLNTTLRGSQNAPSVAASDSGVFTAVWAGRGPGDKQGIFLQQFDATGALVGQELRVNTTIGGIQSKPAIAVSENGSIAVVWSGTGIGDISGVFLQRFDANGQPLGTETLINTTTINHQSSPAVAFDPAGNLVVAWQSRHQDGSDWGIYGRWFEADGTPASDELQLNETTSDSQVRPNLALDPTGGVVIGWDSRNQDGDGWGVIAREFDTSGSAVSTEIVINDETSGSQRDLAIAVAGDGQWLTSWTTGVPDGSGWEIAIRSFDADGTPAPSERVNNTSGANSGHQRVPDVAVSGEKAVIAWWGAGTEDIDGIYARHYKIDSPDGPQQPPDLHSINDREGEVGVAIEIVVTATDPNPLDLLTFFLDGDNSPGGAVLQQINNNSARITWTPSESDRGESVSFRVVVVDNGNPPLADSEEFLVTVAEFDAEENLLLDALDLGFALF